MYEKLVRGQLIGECVMGFGSINLDMDTTLWLTLEPRKALLVSVLYNGVMRLPCWDVTQRAEWHPSSVSGEFFITREISRKTT